jgi:hypothetical protein
MTGGKLLETKSTCLGLFIFRMGSETLLEVSFQPRPGTKLIQLVNVGSKTACCKSRFCCVRLGHEMTPEWPDHGIDQNGIPK